MLGFRMGCSQGLNPMKNRALLASVCRCGSCGLVYVDPMPLPVDIQDHYSAESGHEYHSFGDWQDNLFSSQIQTFTNLYSRDIKNCRALDVGCGSEYVVKSLKRAGFDACGIEPSERFYKEIIRRSPDMKTCISNVTLEDFSHAGSCFDFITFGAVLEHLPFPGEALVKASSILSKGGLIHIEVPNARWLVSDIIDSYYRLLGLRLTTRTSPLHSPYHLYEFSKQSFAAFAARHQLEVARSKSFVTAVPLFPGLVKKPIEWAVSLTQRHMQLEIWLRKLQS